VGCLAFGFRLSYTVASFAGKEDSISVLEKGKFVNVYALSGIVIKYHIFRRPESRLFSLGGFQTGSVCDLQQTKSKLLCLVL
jgi:hypothetical protein